MSKLINFLVIAVVFIPSEVLAYGTGYIAYPLSPNKRLISTEFTGVMSSGGGVGIQGRFTQKVNQKVLVDAGIGVAGGERDSRFFVGGDFELIPDYMKQPRVSIKANWTNAKEFDVRRNILSIAPTVSKGFSFWGHEAFPFFSLPMGVNLQGSNETYETQINANLGITGNLPIRHITNILGVAEATVGIKDSYTAFFVGLSYQLN